MLYAEAATQAWSEEAVLAARSEIFSRAAELGDPAKLNNAVLLAREAYLDRLPAFEDAYVATGSDLRAAIGRIRAASEGSEDPFAAVAEIAAEGAGGGVPEHPGAGGAPAGAFLSPRGRWPAPMTGIQTKSG